MEIQEVKNNKKKYIDLLLLADEQESMIDLYLERGRLFVLFDEVLKALCVVTKESDRVCELKNIAVVPKEQGKGYGQILIECISSEFQKEFDTMLVGTGDSIKTISFYEKCGFQKLYIIPNFFMDNYEHPIIEEGKQLIDMIYLSKNLK